MRYPIELRRPPSSSWISINKVFFACLLCSIESISDNVARFYFSLKTHSTQPNDIIKMHSWEFPLIWLMRHELHTHSSVVYTLILLFHITISNGFMFLQGRFDVIIYQICNVWLTMKWDSPLWATQCLMAKARMTTFSSMIKWVLLWVPSRSHSLSAREMA